MNDEQILALKELGNFKLNDINSQLRKKYPFLKLHIT